MGVVSVIVFFQRALLGDRRLTALGHPAEGQVGKSEVERN